jgi:hypothetical protein
MNKLFLTILILAASTSASGQQAFSSLEEQMTGAEFKATGLEKLSADELAALNNWVRGRSLVTLDAPAAGVLKPRKSPTWIRPRLPVIWLASLAAGTVKPPSNWKMA